MNFYKMFFLSEMMYTQDNIPDETVVIRRRIAGGAGVIFYYADQETGDESQEDGNYSFPPKPTGMIDIHRTNGGIFQLSQVYASDGWGPLLYDLAMEYATAHGKGLMCDPREMSGDAIGVFTYYFYKRNDIKKVLAPQGMVPPKYSSHTELQYVYTKSDQERTTDMRASETLLEY
jgi:hypothetical protein